MDNQRQRPRLPKYEFLLAVEPMPTQIISAAFLNQLRRIVARHNCDSNRVEIIQAVVLAECNFDREHYSVYISLDATKQPAVQQYFSASGNLGTKTFNDEGWKVTHTTIKNPKAQLVDLIVSQEWTIEEPHENDPEYLQVPNWVRNRVRDQ